MSPKQKINRKKLRWLRSVGHALRCPRCGGIVEEIASDSGDLSYHCSKPGCWYKRIEEEK